MYTQNLLILPLNQYLQKYKEKTCKFVIEKAPLANAVIFKLGPKGKELFESEV